MKNANTNELIIGLISGVGSNNKATIQALKEALSVCYEEHHIIEYKVSELFTPENFQKIKPDLDKAKIELIRKNIDPIGFANTYIEMQLGSLGRHLHKGYADIWARLLIEKIHNEEEISEEYQTKKYKVVHIINSLKRKDEIDLLERVYGRNFVILSIFQSEQDRHKFLSSEKQITKIQKEDIDALHEANKILGEILNSEIKDESINIAKHDAAQSLIDKDKKETCAALKNSGQSLEKCFSHGHFFIKSSYPPDSDDLHIQARRFVQLLFGHPFIEPTNAEFYMYCAQGSSLCSLDLDRQVGAVIVNQNNELVSIGYNDVCKVGGGHFEIDDKPDLRDYKKRSDYNHKKLDELTKDMLSSFNLEQPERNIKGNDKFNIVREKLSLITEYKRATHAEMSAILNAARRGVSVKNCTIYINTFPCHNCTKHIIAAGISKVVLLHPYSKSEAKHMFPEMICDSKQEDNKLFFEHFSGVAPARFSFIFEHSAKERQTVDEQNNTTGNVKDFAFSKETVPRYLEYRNAYVYYSREEKIIKNINNSDPLI